jgi:hypothetical protein
MTFNYKEIWTILAKSFEGSFKWKLWKWLLTGSIGALIGTLTFGEKIFHLDTQKSVLYACAFLAILFILRFVLIFIKESLKYFHQVYVNSVYGDAIIILKENFASTHYYRKSPGHNDDEFMKSMMLFCNGLKEIYDKILKSETSVSIKVPIRDTGVKEQTTLMNLTRDAKHISRDTQQYKDLKHTIIGNTPFSYCLSKVVNNSKEKAYINNKVNETENYNNTSRECYGDGKLPYNSELVYPIVPIINESKTNSICHGFICIDSVKQDAFKSKYDVAILEGVADGIYDLISERNNSINNNQN